MNDEDIICTCSGTTVGKIKKLIARGDTLDKISSATGATTGCGACDVLVMKMLEKVED